MRSALVTSATLVLLFLIVPCAAAQEKQVQPKSDELDVTMQIIVDPDAKLPDEIVRRIPLPARNPAGQPASGSRRATPDEAAKGQQRAAEAQELGREMSERARQRAQDAAEQREQARRSIADERRRNPGPPAEPPGPPPTPPRR
jgi:hypothetical protein